MMSTHTPFPPSSTTHPLHPPRAFVFHLFDYARLQIIFSDAMDMRPCKKHRAAQGVRGLHQGEAERAVERPAGVGFHHPEEEQCVQGGYS